MSDELTRAIAEALGCERDEFIDQEGGRRPFCNEHGFIATGWPCPQAEEVAAALAPLIEARVREARREDCERFADMLRTLEPMSSADVAGLLDQRADLLAEEVRNA